LKYLFTENKVFLQLGVVF